MITTNVLHRIFRIRFGAAEGTAFVIDVDGREYLVTAKHVVEGMSGSDRVGVFSNARWDEFPVSLVGHADGDVDISVLAGNRTLVPSGLPLEPTRYGLTYGQDVYFLGFPYGFLGSYILGESGFPLPFVKRATLSLFEGRILFLDGHNNPGFSGGPVVFTVQGNNAFRVAAVVSGYRAVAEPVYEGGLETGLTYNHNTGIIVTHGIDSAVEIARANPIGAIAN
jgi:S1-C subfamily serine protease